MPMPVSTKRRHSVMAGGNARAKRKLAAAGIATLDRCSQVAASGLRVKGLQETDADTDPQ